MRSDVVDFGQKNWDRLTFQVLERISPFWGLWGIGKSTVGKPAPIFLPIPYKNCANGNHSDFKEL
jgi:hypothetical protein